MSPKITVSIINHNSVEPLLHCLQSILSAESELDLLVYFVDNLCEERAQEVLAECYPQIRVISNSKVLGFSANHNQVLRQLETDYVLVLNPDAILSPSGLYAMWDYMQAHQDVGVVGPSNVERGGFIPKPGFRPISLLRELIFVPFDISLVDPRPLWSLKDWLHTAVQKIKTFTSPVSQLSESDQQHSSMNAMDVGWLLGSCMFFRSKALREVGLFDEQFFLYREEPDWCVRALRAGWRVVYLPEIKVYHEGAVSTKSDYLRYMIVFVQSTLRFYRKHAGWPSVLLLQIWLSLINLVNLIRWNFNSLVRPSSSVWRERAAFALKLASVLVPHYYNSP